MTDNITIIHTTANDLLKRLQIDGLIEVRQGGDILVVNVVTGDAALLIGMRGENLYAFEHLLKSLVYKQLGEFVSLMVDVEGYRRRRRDALESVAARIARKVKETGRPEALEPMNAPERRVIHLKIEGLDGVVSESIGEGEDRKVVIKPIMRDVR